MAYINDIFEYIREQVHCDFISDIKYGNNREVAIVVLARVDIQCIDTQQYQDIRNYLGI